MVITPIQITHEEFLKMLKHEIGHGTDGTICKYDFNYLVKVYHSRIFKILDDLEKQNDDDIKIYRMGSGNDKNEVPITAYFYNEENKEHLKMQSKDSIYYAIEKQKSISRTELPKNIVYIDNIFAGCLLKRQHGIGIHKLTGFPLEYRKAIIQEVLISVRELLENNIYPYDIHNSKFAKDAVITKGDGTIEEVGHSHILVNPFTLKTRIIDLYGSSAAYTTHYNENFEKEVFMSLCILLIEFLLQIDPSEIRDYESEIETVAYYLEVARIKSEYIEPLSRLDLNIDEIEDIVKNYTLK